MHLGNRKQTRVSFLVGHVVCSPSTIDWFTYRDWFDVAVWVLLKTTSSEPVSKRAPAVARSTAMVYKMISIRAPSYTLISVTHATAKQRCSYFQDFSWFFFSLCEQRIA